MEKNHNILVDTLIRGMDCANRLQNLICGKMKVDELVSCNDLVMEISHSFSVGLSILKAGGLGEIFGAETSPNMSLASSINRALDVSTGESEAIQPTIMKQGRGCYKRRKSMDSWDKISDTSEDAYQWRKYGQKQILNSKFPRCYYRCTYKDGKGCLATKYVQQLENQSNKLNISYFGHHTCSSTPRVVSHPGPGVVLDFEGFKTHGQYSTSNPSATKSKRIKSLRKQKDLSNKVLSSNDAPSSRALVSKDVLIDESHPRYEASGSHHGGSSPSNIRGDLLAMDDIFENGDFLNEILADDVFFMPQHLWDLR